MPSARPTSSRLPNGRDCARSASRERTAPGAVTWPEASTSATAPATTGAAIEVPDIHPYEPVMVDQIHDPGAWMFSGAPKFENDDFASAFVVEPTVMTLS